VFKRASLRAFSLQQKLPQGGKGSDYKFSFVKYGRNRHSIFRSLNLLSFPTLQPKAARVALHPADMMRVL